MKKNMMILIMFLGIAGLGWLIWSMQHHKIETIIEEVKEIWFCPMHPHYTSDHAGQCPICGMNLVKRKIESQLEVKTKVKDYAQVELSNQQIQLIGIRTQMVKKDIPIKTVQASAYVSTAVELYQIQNEFIDAYVQYVTVFRDYKRIRDRRRSWESHRTLQTQLLKAENNLLKLGLSHVQIERLKKVSWNQIWEQPELLLFNDSQYYWIIAQIEESDLGFVDVGQNVDIEIPAYHEHIKGVVRSVGGIIDLQTRTANALIEVIGHRGELSGNMLAKVNIPVELNTNILVPKTAVMDLGDRKVVFVQKEAGVFEPRIIHVAFPGDDVWAVKSGLVEGELVVIDGNFMLDSESRLRAVSVGVGKGVHHDQ